MPNQSLQPTPLRGAAELNRWVKTMTREAMLMIVLLILSFRAFSTEIVSPHDMVEAAKNCDLLAVYAEGHSWECLEEKSSKPPTDLPCWLGGISYQEVLTTQLAVLKSIEIARNLRTPEEDAQKFFSIGDYRLLRIGGFSIEYPGLADKNLICTLGGHFIAGTTDALESKEHRQFIGSVRTYAEKYNTKMVTLYLKYLSPNKALQPTPVSSLRSSPGAAELRRSASEL